MDLKSQIKFQFGCTTDFNIHLIKNWFKNHPEINKKAASNILLILENLLSCKEALMYNFITIFEKDNQVNAH